MRDLDDIPEDELPEQGLFPIRTVCALTGINPVTLRAWERRHGLIRPRRTPKGHRLYSAEDIERVRQILRLLDQGIAVSQIAPLLDAPVASDETDVALMPDAWERWRDELRGAIAALDWQIMQRVYGDAMSVHPLARVARCLLMPVHDELRTGAHAGSSRALERSVYEGFLHDILHARLHALLGSHRGAARVVVANAAGAAPDALLSRVLVAELGLDPLPMPFVDGGEETLVDDVAQARAVALILVVGSRAPSGALAQRMLALAARMGRGLLVQGSLSDTQAATLRETGALPLSGDLDAMAGSLSVLLRR